MLESGQICRLSSWHAWPWRIASRCATAFALLLALGTPTHAQSSTRREIAFENSRMFGLVLVRVEVNGRPAVLIVDTGSNHTIISSEVADVQPRTLDNAVLASKGSGFAGTGVFAKTTVRIGSITWRDHRIVVMDMRDLSKNMGQKIDGLLGMDFFSEFEIVEVDLKHHKLILEP